MLPDLDDSVSFVVDQGSPVGPLPMRTIIDSIRSGDRAPDVLVWWAGATDWVAFSNDPGLFELLQALPATNQPPPPPEEPDLDDVSADDVSAGESLSENRFPEPEVVSFDVAADDDVAADALEARAGDDPLHDVASELEKAERELELAESDLDEVLAANPVSNDVADDPEFFFDPAAEAEADALLARDPRSMHPSASWGADETRAIDTEAFQRALDEQRLADDVESASPAHHDDPVEAVEAGSSSEAPAEAEAEPVVAESSAPETVAIDPVLLDELESEVDDLESLSKGGLSGLFGSPSRPEPVSGVSDLDEPFMPADASTSSLQNVGARIDALTSATRRAQQRGDLDHGDADLDRSDVDFDHGDLDRGDVDPSGIDPSGIETGEGVGEETSSDDDHEFSTGSWQAVAEGPDSESSVESVPEPEPSAPSEPALVVELQPEPAADVEDRFSEMVRRSVAHQRRLDWALRPDELLLSSCITTIVDRGYVLLDVENHEVSQRAVFDHNDDSRHVRLELSPLSPVNAAGDPVGRHVQVSVAWGRGVRDADEAFATVRANATDEAVDPGTITFEVNMVASSATTAVDLIWAAGDFVGEDQSVDRAALDASMIAILQTLEARWHELFTAS